MHQILAYNMTIPLISLLFFVQKVVQLEGVYCNGDHNLCLIFTTCKLYRNVQNFIPLKGSCYTVYTFIHIHTLQVLTLGKDRSLLVCVSGPRGMSPSVMLLGISPLSSDICNCNRAVSKV